MEEEASDEANKSKMKPNELKVVSSLLTRLSKHLHLLRLSLSEGKGIENLKEKFTIRKESSLMDDGNELTIFPSTEEYKVVLDCCDFETAVDRILNELKEFGTYQTLKAAVQEYEETGVNFKKHQKLLECKRQEIVDQKNVLSIIREKDQPLQKHREDVFREMGEMTAENLTFVKEWMQCKLDSKKEYYDHLVKKVREKTEYFEKEAQMQIHTDIQTISFWLLKYESFIRELEILVRKAFDEWASKKRDISILEKFRKVNLDKIQRISKEIAMREETIEADRKEREIENGLAKEQLKKDEAATLIQACWRGTMVRKHLGPYKIKKKKKKKGKKGQKEKKKGKK
ncbi:uncharacterized protein CDAR_535231 [Caerostris darwini]|uniref:Dynein regulatory complex protein 9 n=1 Tax=Caerostris darwini TaxID=1538125 RepID=A0AAV4QM83_9ARAC|nr:uncharacterized protein CDAR_535231 [Caerostris darwini]